MRLLARAWILLQYGLPQHAITALVYRVARARTPWLRRVLIRSFRALYAVDLSAAAEPDPEKYASFNAFFTRALKPGARPLCSGAHEIASPCDGRVSECGAIVGSDVLQARLAAKNRTYTLAELLGDAGVAAAYADGSFATIYLAPHDYHRVHVPLAGRLTSLRYLPGRLFSVNVQTASAVPRLYARNERVVCHFETADGPYALVFVGALNVGSIVIAGFGELTPRRSRRATTLALPDLPAFARGAELGRFNLGSTVVLLLPRGRCSWLPALAPGARVTMGAAIGRLEA